MRYENGRVKDCVIAYIGGGSRGWAIQLMKDLAVEESLAGTVRLYDIDVDAAGENEIVGNKISRGSESKGKWIYKTFTNLDNTLADSDFIIISILPGTFAEMAVDVHTPEQFGIYQSVGDTVGPGGLMRALRTIPMYVELAEHIKKYASDAWVINYTNPMALCVRTLYEVFPEIKAFGCCHEVFGTQWLLAEMLQDLHGIEMPAREDIKVNVLGINHFTWIDRASYRTTDLFSLYKDFADKYYDTGFAKPGGTGPAYVFTSRNRVKFDLFKRYGLIAAAGDRHLAEFLPQSWYLKDPETVSKWKFYLTPVDFRIGLKNEVEAFRKRLMDGTEKLEIKPSGEEGTRQIKALLGLGDLVTNVNLPNQGQVRGLPDRAVVETNAVLTRDSIKPVMAGGLPLDLNNIVLRHSVNQETVLKAAIERDRSLAIRALLNDPLASLDPADASDLFDLMFEGTKKYLPGW